MNIEAILIIDDTGWEGTHFIKPYVATLVELRREVEVLKWFPVRDRFVTGSTPEEALAALNITDLPKIPNIYKRVNSYHLSILYEDYPL